MNNEPTISVQTMFDIAKEKYGWDDTNLADDLGISLETLAQLATETVKAEQTALRLIPNFYDLQKLADKYDMNQKQRDALLKILNPPLWDDPRGV